jgi:hypothetical protein
MLKETWIAVSDFLQAIVAPESHIEYAVARAGVSSRGHERWARMTSLERELTIAAGHTPDTMRGAVIQRGATA